MPGRPALEEEVPGMRVLFIGGTGLISSACAAASVAAGHDLWLLTRGRSRLGSPVPPERTITADAYNEAEVRAAVGPREWDVVVQWNGYLPSHVQQDLRVFSRARQYVFISTAATYEKPPSHWLVTESTPQSNPYWDYGRQKIACEALLVEAGKQTGFPYTIVRPSLTYGPSQVPVVIGSWESRTRSSTACAAAPLSSSPATAPAFGPSPTTATSPRASSACWATRPRSARPSTSPPTRRLRGTRFYSLVGAAAGAEPNVLHVPSDAIVAADPDELGSLFGDKIHSTVFDNGKLRSRRPRLPGHGTLRSRDCRDRCLV